MVTDEMLQEILGFGGGVLHDAKIKVNTGIFFHDDTVILLSLIHI